MEKLLTELLNETIRQDKYINEKLEAFPDEHQQDIRTLIEACFVKGMVQGILGAKAKREKNIPNYSE